MDYDYSLDLWSLGCMVSEGTGRGVLGCMVSGVLGGVLGCMVSEGTRGVPGLNGEWGGRGGPWAA